MISQSVIGQVKQIPLIEYLKKEGFTPYKSWSRYVRFHSPLRMDQRPSFDVDLNKNVWHDRGANEGGDIIEFVKRYRNCSFGEAVDELSGFASSFSFRPLIDASSKQSYGIRNLTVAPLANPVLIQYIESRSVESVTAKKHLCEAQYTSGRENKAYYSLAWANKLGGYELRNKYFKGCTGSKSYTLIRAANHSLILLFEGMIDFLSFLVLSGQSEPIHPVLILNSTTTLNDELIPKLIKFEVHTYLDNDSAGDQAMKLLKANSVKVKDHRSEYPDHKDLNEYLVSRKKYWKKN